MRYLMAFMACCLLPLTAHAQVVASIKPLHSLVAGVMEGDTPPALLANGGQSLHHYALKPSQAKQLQHAQVLFYIGGGFEPFLSQTLKNKPETLIAVALADAQGVEMLPALEGKEGRSHEEHGGYDLHIWLSPANAQRMVEVIANTLSEVFPDKRALYEANAKKMAHKLAALDRRLAARMKPLQARPFGVFHNAYRYFQVRYGLSLVGAVTPHPEQGISAKHLSELRSRLKTSGAVCMFREPQFDGKVVDNLLEGLSIQSGVLDPEGAAFSPGAGLYFRMMEALAASLEGCLAS